LLSGNSATGAIPNPRCLTQMKTTFVDLGIPFPLFEAPVDASDESEYIGNRTCSLCGTPNAPCFSLGIGDDLMIACPSCQSVNGLDVSDKAGVPCRSCSVAIEFPASVAAKKETVTCYSCLRAGKVALTETVPLVLWTTGMVRSFVSSVSIGRPLEGDSHYLPRENLTPTNTGFTSSRPSQPAPMGQLVPPSPQRVATGCRGGWSLLLQTTTRTQLTNVRNFTKIGLEEDSFHFNRGALGHCTPFASSLRT
jgi:hypothetical protein